MKPVDSILWRNYNQATVDTLTGTSKGQYDIRLGAKNNFDAFFDREPHTNPTLHGGYDIDVQIEAYSDPVNPAENIASQKITVRYMGAGSARKDWYIRSQRPHTAYPFWIDPLRFSGSEERDSYVLLIKTTDGKYYGRNLLSSELPGMPAFLRNAITASPEVGMYVFSARISGDAEKIYRQLLAHNNLLMDGPPGTGKTTLMQEVVEIFENGGVSKLCFDETSKAPSFGSMESAAHSKTSWVTFHQSYSYDEFIIGMMTDHSSSDKLLDIRPVQGKFLELSEYAREEGHRALLVIDELNRANVSRVFGELITVVEPGKRLDANGNKTANTVAVQLPYIKPGEPLLFTMDGKSYEVENPFYMPYPVYIIASMNSIDKSIFPLDSALRRRFRFYNLYPDADVLSAHFGISGKTYSAARGAPLSVYTCEDILLLVRDFLKYVNSKIVIFLGADYTLGQSYVWNMTEASDVHESIKLFRADLFEQILPQLEELFRNRTEQLEYILGCSAGKDGPYFVIEPSEEEIDLGAVPMMLSRENDASFSDDALLHWMEETVEK